MKHEIRLPRHLFDILHTAVKLGLETAEDGADNPAIYVAPLADWQRLAATFEMTARFQSPIAVVTVDDAEMAALDAIFLVHLEGNADLCSDADYDAIAREIGSA